jgi:uncharacterized membrane protein
MVATAFTSSVFHLCDLAFKGLYACTECLAGLLIVFTQLGCNRALSKKLIHLVKSTLVTEVAEEQGSAK